MTNISLSKRLSAAAAEVRAGSVVADVGCDHGKLSAYLILSGRAAAAVATDIRPEPLARAAALFSSLGITQRAQTLLCDGLAGVDVAALNDVIIAGLGGECIAGIIERAPALKNCDKKLILVPASRHGELRRYLAAAGFGICAETAVCECAHHYSVISAFYGAAPRALTDVEALCGLVDPGTADGCAYIKAQCARERRALAGYAGGAAPDPNELCRRRNLIAALTAKTEEKSL